MRKTTKTKVKQHRSKTKLKYRSDTTEGSLELCRALARDVADVMHYSALTGHLPYTSYQTSLSWIQAAGQLRKQNLYSFVSGKPAFEMRQWNLGRILHLRHTEVSATPSDWHHHKPFHLLLHQNMKCCNETLYHNKIHEKQFNVWITLILKDSLYSLV